MENFDIENALKYIDKHIEEKLYLYDIAKNMGYVMVKRIDKRVYIGKCI